MKQRDCCDGQRVLHRALMMSMDVSAEGKRNDIMQEWNRVRFALTWIFPAVTSRSRWTASSQSACSSGLTAKLLTSGLKTGYPSRHD